MARLPDRWRTIDCAKPTGIDSPWGEPDSAEWTEIRDGHWPGAVHYVSTPRHGGAILTGSAVYRAATMFPDFVPFAQAPLTLRDLGNRTPHVVYLEEDCDLALMPLIFPELYDSTSFDYSRAFIRCGAIDGKGNDRSRQWAATYFRACDSYLAGRTLLAGEHYCRHCDTVHDEPCEKATA